MVSGSFAEITPFSTPFRDLLHAANLRHGTDGVPSPPKEGMLRIKGNAINSFNLIRMRKFGQDGHSDCLTRVSTELGRHLLQILCPMIQHLLQK
jgi:hypothetical protein